MKQKDIDLVLVNQGDKRKVFQSLGVSLAASEPPVWAGMMATFARKQGLRVLIIDAAAEDLSPDETAKRVRDIDPVLTAVIVYGHQPSASTQNMPSAGAVCAAIKQIAPELKILLAGGHVASLPERTLREEDADYVATGEGLYTIVDLVSALKSSESDPKTVRGLVYWDGKAIARSAPAPLLMDLDQWMPGIAWDLLPMEHYRAHNWHCFADLQREPYAAIYTTLGCPYRCHFCCIQAPFKSGEKLLGYSAATNTYRMWSPESVAVQLDILVNRYGVRNIKFADEIFVLNRAHVEGICDCIIQRGYELNIWAYARVDTIKDGMLEKLKKAGVNWLAVGFESANERVRKDVEKDYRDNDVARSVKQIQDTGINVIGNYIFGLPEDDYASMTETFQMAVDLNCEFANFYCTMAYPGSKLYEQAVHKGWQLPKSWSGYSQHAVDTLPLPTKHLPASDVLKFRDKAFKAYFTNSGYLDMVARKFGQRTIDHIREMAGHELERKYA